jgi:hypothetical protein
VAAADKKKDKKRKKNSFPVFDIDKNKKLWLYKGISPLLFYSPLSAPWTRSNPATASDRRHCLRRR